MPMIFNFSFNNINLTIQDPQVFVLSHLVIILHNFNSDFFVSYKKYLFKKQSLSPLSVWINLLFVVLISTTTTT